MAKKDERITKETATPTKIMECFLRQMGDDADAARCGIGCDYTYVCEGIGDALDAMHKV